MWEALGLLGVLTLWGAIGLLGYCATLIAIRRPAAPFALPLAVLAAIGAALLVPALGGKDALGFALSLPTALAAGFVAPFVIALPATVRLTRRSLQ